MFVKWHVGVPAHVLSWQQIWPYQASNGIRILIDLSLQLNPWDIVQRVGSTSLPIAIIF